MWGPLFSLGRNGGGGGGGVERGGGFLELSFFKHTILTFSMKLLH